MLINLFQLEKIQRLYEIGSNTSIIYSNYILTRSFELTTQIYFVKVTRTRPFLGKTFTVCKYKIGVYAIDLQPKCSPNCNQLRFSCCADKCIGFNLSCKIRPLQRATNM